MSEEEFEKTLFYGDVYEVKKIQCPECGGVIRYDFLPAAGSLNVLCGGCGLLRHYDNALKPKCVDVLGNSYIFEK